MGQSKVKIVRMRAHAGNLIVGGDLEYVARYLFDYVNSACVLSTHGSSDWFRPKKPPSGRFKCMTRSLPRNYFASLNWLRQWWAFPTATYGRIVQRSDYS